MAAKNAWVTCAKGAWTQLTDNAGTTADVTLVLISGGMTWIQATTSASAPSDLDGAMPLYEHGQGWSEATIDEKFPNNASNAHLYAFSPAGSTISIAHAA